MGPLAIAMLALAITVDTTPLDHHIEQLPPEVTEYLLSASKHVRNTGEASSSLEDAHDHHELALRIAQYAGNNNLNSNQAYSSNAANPLYSLQAQAILAADAYLRALAHQSKKHNIDLFSNSAQNAYRNRVFDGVNADNSHQAKPYHDHQMNFNKIEHLSNVVPYSAPQIRISPKHVNMVSASDIADESQCNKCGERSIDAENKALGRNHNEDESEKSALNKIYEHQEPFSIINPPAREVDQAECNGGKCRVVRHAQCSGNRCREARHAQCSGNKCFAARRAQCSGSQCYKSRRARCSGGLCYQARRAQCSGGQCRAARRVLCSAGQCRIVRSIGEDVEHTNNNKSEHYEVPAELEADAGRNSENNTEDASGTAI